MLSIEVAPSLLVPLLFLLLTSMIAFMTWIVKQVQKNSEHVIRVEEKVDGINRRLDDRDKIIDRLVDKVWSR